ncbi:MAG: EAL domain-containing protein [Solirubrobacteraceae bacterium]|nr:EAL domain-containing protein [Solirubrobacteraceae bacterium]
MNDLQARLDAALTIDDRPRPTLVDGPRRDIDAAAINRLAGDEATFAVQVLDAIPGVLVTILDRDGRIISLRTREEVLPGRSSAELIGRRLIDELPKAEGAALSAAHAQALHGIEQSFRLTVPAEGGQRVLDITTGPLHTGPVGQQEIAGVVAVARDVTDLVRAQDRLTATVDRFRTVFRKAPLPMAMLAPSGAISEVNDEFAALVGRSRNSLLSRYLVQLIDARDREAVEAVLPSVTAGTLESTSIDVRLQSTDEVQAFCELHLTARDPSDPQSNVIVQLVDRSERQRHDAQLRYLAGHDSLTGLLNRATFEEALEAHLENCARFGYEGAMLLVDIDHFRQVNDVHGRAAGDRQLVELTGLLQRGLGGSAVVARLERDEFAVLITDGDRTAALQSGERLRATAHDHARAARATRRPTFTLSIGVAPITPETVTPADVIVLAEHAVARAKHNGRDRVLAPELVIPERDGKIARPSQTAIGRLRAAIREERFELHAQPIVRLADDAVSQYELLVRMRDEDGDLVPPGAFLPLAEHYGLVGEIDAWVARTAVSALTKVERDVLFQLNLSGRSLGHPALLDGIAEGLRSHSVAAKRLVFELTETAAIANLPLAAAFAERLRGLGCELALDDFGIGFGGLQYLKHLPCSYVKIDGEFIAGVARSPTDQVILDGILQITRRLGVKTVAEFVGDDACLAHLRDVGVDFAQGFYLGRPQPLTKLLTRLA